MAEPSLNANVNQAVERLRRETQYLLDVLHISGDGYCYISAASLRRTVDGMMVVLDLLVQAPPAGAPATPAAGGGT